MNKEEIIEMIEQIGYEEFYRYYQEKDKYIELLKNELVECFKNELEQLQQENKQLKEELEKLKQPQIFIDTGDMEERYGEQLYQNYLKEQLDLYKSVIDEIISIVKGVAYGGSEDYYIEKFKEILDKTKGE